jgi:hypothetical protein
MFATAIHNDFAEYMFIKQFIAASSSYHPHSFISI